MENTPATIQVGQLELDSNSHTDRMEPSPAATLVDYDACILSKSKSIGVPSQTDEPKKSDIPILSQRRKWSLLMVFCLGFFIDIWMYSGTYLHPSSIITDKTAFFVFTGPISTDLAVPFEQQTWVITSYAVRLIVSQTSVTVSDRPGNIRRVPPILGTCIRLVLGQTSIRLRIPITRYPLTCDIIPTRSILLFCDSSD